jgi:uncharacterized protein (TIGR00369 family)
MDIRTHKDINNKWCGKPLALSAGQSQVALTVTAEMTVDNMGLAHGGFVFGLADHAAMLAVNHPNVVLGAAKTRFLKPVKTGDKLVADAKITDDDGRKKLVDVDVRCRQDIIFSGIFTCFVLDQHVLA